MILRVGVVWDLGAFNRGVCPFTLSHQGRGDRWSKHRRVFLGCVDKLVVKVSQ